MNHKLNERTGEKSSSFYLSSKWGSYVTLQTSNRYFNTPIFDIDHMGLMPLLFELVVSNIQCFEFSHCRHFV